jgi:hypothetical protein
LAARLGSSLSASFPPFNRRAANPPHIRFHPRPNPPTICSKHRGCLFVSSAGSGFCLYDSTPGELLYTDNGSLCLAHYGRKLMTSSGADAVVFIARYPGWDFLIMFCPSHEINEYATLLKT